MSRDIAVSGHIGVLLWSGFGPGDAYAASVLSSGAFLQRPLLEVDQQ